MFLQSRATVQMFTGELHKNYMKYMLKSDPNERTFSWHSGFDHHRFLQVMSHFVGSSPSRGDIFFLKSNIKWAFSYILIH